MAARVRVPHAGPAKHSDPTTSTKETTVPLPPLQFPLRAKHARQDPVHAVRSILSGGHNTACLIWLDPKAPHQWLSEGTEITCSKCIKAMGAQCNH